MNQVQFEEILSQVNRPGRYLGNEINSIKKSFVPGMLKIALCFPDLYEIGMSYLGLRILYGLLNEQNDILCERVFLPDRDFEGILRKNGIPLFSLESRFALSEFDIIGFSLNYELNYINILKILDLAGIPLKQNERQENFPLIIAGGNCCLNPEPVADFFDLFVVGEAEEVILEILDAVRTFKRENKSGKSTKKDLLSKMSNIEGVYAPSLYNVEYSEYGNSVPAQIKKRFVRDLDKVYYPTSWIVPYISIVHDRIGLEIMRGCPNQCAFCQAKASFWPLRKRSIPTILRLAQALYETSGYEKISLLSLSTSDYPNIKELIQVLLGMYKDKAVSITLPSLKAKSIVTDLAEIIASVRKSSLTFAPEAGSLRLRQLMAKDFDSEGLYNLLENAKNLGYRQIKLYFMIGLPTETKQDLDGIIEFVANIVFKYKIRLTVSIANFIPKPHTPFQWLSMDSLESLAEKQRYLSLKMGQAKRYVKLDFHNIYISLIECLLSRGGRRLSEVILKVFKSSSNANLWHDDFNFEVWKESAASCNIDMSSYCHTNINPEAVLRWEHIDIGLNKKYLFMQLQNALTKNKL